MTTQQYLWADRYFWIAVVLCLAIQFYPNTRWILWPLRQFGTYVHELFHGLSALISGGAFNKMQLFSNNGGVAYTVSYGPFSSSLISAGGLLGPSILGGVMLFFSRRFFMSHYLLMALGTMIIASAIFWVRDWYTAGFCIMTGLILGATWFVKSKTVVRIFAQFLGVQLCLENLLDFRYMFTQSFQRGGETLYSDTANIAKHFGGNYILWGTVIAALTLLIITFSLIKSRPQFEGPKSK